jgi:hypothetical protein
LSAMRGLEAVYASGGGRGKEAGSGLGKIEHRAYWHFLHQGVCLASQSRRPS